MILRAPRSIVRAAVALATTGILCGTVAAAAPALPATALPAPALPATHGTAGRLAAAGWHRACAQAKPGDAQCFTWYRPQTTVNRALRAGARPAATKPVGWSPQDLQSAYKLPASTSSTQTVAVSVAYNAPDLSKYLAVYRQHYGLPACTTASGCLRIVNAEGAASPLPASGVPTGWALEETLDVSMISAACPHCHILVVEGKSPSFASLAATEDTAARLGAQVISNSYGGSESGYTQAQASHYDHPGHVIVAASGDAGYGPANFPANLTTVTAVGGTELARADNARGWTEQVWNFGFGASGSGCSAYVAKPAWQHDKHCPGRTVADVSAIAYGVPIYNPDFSGWVTVEGTSIATPFVAGVYGLAGNAASLSPGSVYAHPGSLFDVTTGSNAQGGTPKQVCGGDYLCAAKKGYDAPTGLGTPDGTGDF